MRYRPETSLEPRFPSRSGNRSRNGSRGGFLRDSGWDSNVDFKSGLWRGLRGEKDRDPEADLGIHGRGESRGDSWREIPRDLRRDLFRDRDGHLQREFYGDIRGHARRLCAGRTPKAVAMRAYDPKARSAAG